MNNPVVDDVRKLGMDQRRQMLQPLLADRFKLMLHRETKELPVYALVIAKNGPKLQESKPGDTYPNGLKRSDGQPQGLGLWTPGEGKIFGQGVSNAYLVRLLSQQLGGRIVVDKTGLTGKYDFRLQWTPDESQGPMFTAIQEQLGLELESQKSPVEVLVIDHAEKPSEN